MYQRVIINTDILKKRVLNYLSERKCESGGYCFYRQSEPNLSDTFWALAINSILKIHIEDQITIDYLLSAQNDDGSYLSIIHAYYALYALATQNLKPIFNPENYLIQELQVYDPKNLPAGVNSIFKKAFFTVGLCTSFNVEINPIIRNGLIDFVLQFYNSDHGFGLFNSSLLETYQALTILTKLGYNIRQLKTRNYILKCLHPLFGFTNVPNTSLSYLEYIHAGILTLDLIKLEKLTLNQCINFVLHCQTSTGGFSRVIHGGIATLENTYYAIHSLSLLIKGFF